MTLGAWSLENNGDICTSWAPFGAKKYAIVTWDLDYLSLDNATNLPHTGNAKEFEQSEEMTFNTMLIITKIKRNFEIPTTQKIILVHFAILVNDISLTYVFCQAQKPISFSIGLVIVDLTAKYYRY